MNSTIYLSSYFDGEIFATFWQQRIMNGTILLTVEDHFTAENYRENNVLART